MKTLIIDNNIGEENINCLHIGLDIVSTKLKTIGIDMEFGFFSTSRTYTGYETAPGSQFYAVKGQEIFDTVKDLPNKTYDYYCLMYDWMTVEPHNPNPLLARFNPCQYPLVINNGIPMSMPVQWYGGYAEVFAEFFLHEMCHAEYFRQGKSAQDQTHNKAHFPEFNQKSSMDFYLFLLKQLRMAPTPPVTTPKAKVTISRQYQDKQVLGTLYIDGVPFCKTLELPWKDNKSNISCVPKGVYNVAMSYWTSKKKSTYLLAKVPGRGGIRIHSGNYSGSINPKTGRPDIQGCILLGNSFGDINKDGIVEILNSTITMKAFEDKMKKLPFTLEIK